ncbi:MAG: hypothetical protein M9945_07945 [Aquamicrobium sp.]|uniref:hypothetical protein n=1 Tax=Aquamicrobium sp. TaxID=1872579 RepID=UPI00349EBF50|nr:hypothetical protein [Aquamicrobium sp.]
MNLAATRARARRWTEHDAKVPFRDERLFRMNGTNPTGRRPRSFDLPQLLRPANDNREDVSDAA